MDRKAFYKKYGCRVWDLCYNISESILNGKRKILIKAPVKSGKKVINQCFTYHLPCSEFDHFYVVSLNRKDVKKQRTDLEQYNINIALTVTKKCTEESIKNITDALDRGRQVVIHIDECDYGSAVNQQMSSVWSIIKDNPNAIVILYSATPEETSLSDIVNDNDFEEFVYVPPPEYKSAAYFLDNGLVHQMTKFFDEKNMDITDEGKKALKRFSHQRHIAVVRLCNLKGGFQQMKENQVFKQKVKHLCKRSDDPYVEVAVHWIDQHSDLDWENEDTWKYNFSREHFHIIIINQKCCRGTDFNYLAPYLAFFVDTRPHRDANYNTLAQAFLRICHYHDSGHPIHVYLNSDIVLKLAAGRISISEYIKQGGKICQRTTTVRRNDYPHQVFSSFEEVTAFLRQERLADVKIQDFEVAENGMYKAYVRSSKEVYTYEYVMKNRNWGFSKSDSSRRRVYPCYQDISDPSSLTWVVTWNDGVVRDAVAVITNDKSMYSTS